MHVLVAMSGGVDSSVAAALLRDAGHDVTGVTLKLWGGPSDSGCCSVSDVEDARRVAGQLGIPHYVFNFTDDFGRDVVEPYVASHRVGETPNPCVECNRSVKFGRLLERADALGFDAVATGHHARVERVAGTGAGGTDRFRLLRGVDTAKDQSYVLYMLGQRELARALFPVGHLTKAGVRERAGALGLRTADKPESMEVCFITKGGRTPFLEERGAMRPGSIVDATGATVGRHDGAARFTVGQRRGLDVAVGERRYVVDVDAATSTVTIGHHDDLLRDGLTLRDVTWVDDPPRDGAPLAAQTRAHGAPHPCTAAPSSTCEHFGLHRRPQCSHVDVVWETAQPRVAPGQVVALYDGDEVVGGGIAE